MSYHRKSKQVNGRHKFKVAGPTVMPGAKGPSGAASHVTHTDGPGCWMDVPQTMQQPKEQLPPTDAKPVRLHHRMGLPYTTH